MDWFTSSGWFVGLAAIIAWAVVAISSMRSHTRLRELEIRERIAMIERGLVPPPEVDPGGFDRAMYHHERHRYRSLGRHRRAGIILIGVGFGLMALIALAGDEPQTGAGVGGFLVVLGVAFLVAGLFDDRSRFDSRDASRTPDATRRDQPVPPQS
jgi:hypothetical protein